MYLSVILSRGSEAQGKASASFVQQVFEDVIEGHDPVAKEDIKGVAASMYAGKSLLHIVLSYLS